MSTYKCPECGSPINLNERHCANCDYDVTDAEYAGVAPQPVAPHAEKPQAPQMPTSQSPASTAGRVRMMRSTSFFFKAATAKATAK